MSNNRQIDVDFVNFIAEKVKNVNFPINHSELCREFKKKTGISYKNNNLLFRLQIIRDKMSEMENFDIDTKVTMIFALSAPVSNGCLIELKKHADVELDEQHRIIEYKKNGNGFQLSGVHIGRSIDIRREKEMLKFLAEKSENATSPMIDKTFLKEFTCSEGNFKAGFRLYRRYNLLKKQIYLSPEFDEDEDTKIKMMFLSNTKLHANILEELRQNAIVEVDELRRITRYKANDGSWKLEGERKKLSTEPITEWSKEEKENILSFVVEKSKQKVPLLIKSLSKEFAEKNGMHRSMHAVEQYLYRNLLNISKLNDFDMETRIRMIFALGVSVDKGFLNKLRKDAVVKVDKHQRITKYEANDRSLKLEGERRKLPKRLKPTTLWSKKENDKLWNYIAEKSNQTKSPLFIKRLSREFAEKNEMSRTKGAVAQNIHRSVNPQILKQDEADMDTKIKMTFALSIPVDEEFLNKLRKEAFVEIDEKRRITKYKANDGSLELNGDHSLSVKMRTIRTQKKNKSINYETSETDDQTDDYDDEENEEEEEDYDEDSEDEDVEEVSRPFTEGERLLKRRYSKDHSFCDSNDDVCESSGSVKKTKVQKTEKITKRATSQIQKGRKIRHTYFSETDGGTEDDENEEEYLSTRRSKRISKKRYPDNDFSLDFDDFSLDSPENGKYLTVEKETEDLVEKSSNSSSESPFVTNLKREYVENPSDAISSLSKSSKYGRLVDTQNETESDKINIASKVNDEEVKYDGIGESLSLKKVKLEDVNYKPDLSFLFNPTQNNMQNFSGTSEDHTNNVDQSENTDEMTSGKDVTKLLHGLVTTLDSPILVELQSKIEEAIEKLGDGDHKIPTEDIVTTLNTGFMILNKSATMIPLIGESTSLRELFLMLRSTLSTLFSSSFSTFQLKLREAIKKLDSQDKIIPIESIRPVLETLLLLALP